MAKQTNTTASKKPNTTASKKPEAKPEVAKAFAHWPVGGSAYDGLRSGKLKGALTAAALIVAGYAKFSTPTATAISSTGAKGNASLFRALTGSKAYTEWNHQGRIEGDKLTAGGLNHVNERMSGASRNPYNTEPGIVRAVLAAMTKGGKVEIAGHAPVTFDRPIK